MNINEFAKEVHQNAVAHGWWDGERTTEEIIALIHSEWSEALEEARAGMPMAYQVQSHGIVQGRIQTDMAKWFPGQKPEGIGVELVDGCIRILDYLGKMNVVFMDNPTLDHLMRTTPEKAYRGASSPAGGKPAPQNLPGLFHAHAGTRRPGIRQARLRHAVRGHLDCLRMAYGSGRKRGAADAEKARVQQGKAVQAREEVLMAHGYI